MSTTSDTAVTTQVYSVYIKATPRRVWDAITQPEWTEKYNYASRADYDLKPGGRFQATPGAAMLAGAAEAGFDVPDVLVEGEVIEVDPPHKLVQTWHFLMDPEMKEEGVTRLTWELTAIDDQVTKLTVVHDLEGAPKLAVMVGGGRESEGAGGGWLEVLSGLKTVLETGEQLRL
jgi:uncharacterized protein YndB with AHSA1/START domain